MDRFHAKVVGKFVSYCFLFSLTLSLLGCESATSQKESLIIIGTGDLQGMVEPYEQEYEINGSKEKLMGGGISRIASVFKEAKLENLSGTFILSSGDDLMGSYFHTFKGKAIYSLMSQSGYMLYAPGNHEFDKGPEIFAHALDSTSFDTICSDLSIVGTVLEGRCMPYKIIESKGTTIGFFSLITEDLPLITTSGEVKLSADNLTTAQKMVSILKSKQCDVIVAITHIGLSQDKKIAEQVEGIDVIFGGHSHAYTQEVVDENDTLIVNAGEEGSYVVKLLLPLDSKHHIQKDKVEYKLIPITSSIAKDEAVEETLQSYKVQLPAAVTLGRTTVEWDLTTDALRKEESSIADLINDLLRDKFSVDVVMNNGGALRGKKIYPLGDITDTRLHEIDEFSNNVYIMNIKGKYLCQILEHSAASYGEGGFMQVSGIHYTIDLSKQAQVLKYNDDGSWTIVEAGERVSDVKIVIQNSTLQSLEDEKVYKVLSNAYLVTHAGDGYFWFKQYGSDSKNTYTSFYTIMTNYLENHTVMDPKAVDGRLKILH